MAANSSRNKQTQQPHFLLDAQGRIPYDSGRKKRHPSEQPKSSLHFFPENHSVLPEIVNGQMKDAEKIYEKPTRADIA